MEKLVLEYIKKNNLIEENDKVLVAVSGGPDSICLLNILYNLRETLKIELFVAHVNHLIRKDAKSDAEYVQKYCEDRNINFFLKECNVQEKSKREKISVEEAGRNVRYDFFKEIANKNNINKIAIGHNKNDLAETLIMNILRGTGTQGLKGIVSKNLIGNCDSFLFTFTKNSPSPMDKFNQMGSSLIDKKYYIRPLLDTSREDIEKYCAEQNLQPRIDSTNFENEYTRNKIRNIVIPYIKEEFNPNIIETLVRLSQIATEEQEFIELEVEKQYKNIVTSEENNNIKISAKEFVKLNIAIKKRLILYIIKKLFGTTKQIEKIHIEDIIKLIENNIGNKYLTPNKNLKISIAKGIVEFKKV